MKLQKEWYYDDYKCNKNKTSTVKSCSGEKLTPEIIKTLVHFFNKKIKQELESLREGLVEQGNLWSVCAKEWQEQH